MIPDPERLMIAQAYATMSGSPAFTDMMRELEEDAARAESLAASAPASASDHTVRALFVAWQERRKTLILIRELVSNALQYVVDFEQEINDARGIELDRSSRDNWSA